MRFSFSAGQISKNFSIPVYAFVVISVLVFIWVNRFLPLQDYPDWVFQGYVLSTFLRGEPIEGYKIGNYFAPNLICTVAIAFGDLLFHPETSGKVFLTIYVLLFAIGTLYFFKSTGAHLDHPLLLVPALLVLNDMFWFGFLNYICGLALLFLSMGYLASRIQRNEVLNPWILLALSLAIYFCHAICYASFVIFILAILLIQQNKANISRLLLPLAPSLALMAIYVFAQSQSGISVRLSATGTWALLKHLTYKVSTGISAVSLFSRFYPLFDFKPGLTKGLALINLVFAISLFAIACRGLYICILRKETSCTANNAMIKILTISLFTNLILFAILPVAVADVADPGQRFIYPSLWLLLSMLARESTSPSGHYRGQVENSSHSQKSYLAARLRGLIRYAILFLIIAQMIFLHTYVRSISGYLSRFWTELRSFDLHKGFDAIYESDFDYEGEFNHPLKNMPFLRLPSHSPLDRIHYYFNIEKRIHSRIFHTGMIIDTKSPPPIKSISSIRNMTVYPDRIIIIGEPNGIRFIAGYLRSRYRIEERDYAILLSRIDLN